MKTRLLIIIGIIVFTGLIIPNAFGICTSLPCDSFIKSDEHHDFLDFSYANRIGEPIKFILEKTGYGGCNSYEAEIIDENGNLVWGEGKFALCDPIDNPRLITSQIKIGYNEDNPIIINESGKYYLEIEIDSGLIKREFVVRQNHTGVSLDRTEYPVSWFNLPSPLKQIKNGIKFHNVECNEGLVLAQRGNSERSACVTLDTKIELTIRGWADDDRILLGCLGERVQKCYPEDKDEYRKKLQRYYYGFNEESDFKIDVMCMTLETSKDTATFFKIPSYLPEGYSFKCSFSGTPYESYLIFDNKKVPDGWISHYPELVSDGAIFIHQTDQKSPVGEKEFATYGSATQRIQDTYDSVMVENPSLYPQLIRINGMLAYVVDSCDNCGMQTANFTDGTIIQHISSTEAKIKFIDENGVSYFLKAGIPLNELIKVAESLQ